MLQEACLKRVYKLYYYNMNSSQNLLLFVHTAGRGGMNVAGGVSQKGL